MLFFTIISLWLLALVNYHIGKRLLYPPVVFCSVWATDLLLVWIMGNFFYPISVGTLLIFQVGAWAFSIGSAAAFFMPSKAKPPEYDLHTSNSIITFLLAIMILAIPLLYRWLSIIAAPYSSNVMVGAYMALSDGWDKVEGSFIYGNLLMLSGLVLLFCVCERQDHGRRAILAVTVALAVQTMSGIRSGLAILIPATIAIDWIRRGKLNVKLLVCLALLLVGFLSVLSVVVPKVNATDRPSSAQLVGAVGDGLALYAVGGLQAFSQVVEDPNTVPHDWKPLVFFYPWINRLGGHLIIPRNAQFVNVGPHGSQQNVYTMYFSFFDYGYLGMMTWVLVIGFGVTLAYKKALAGDRIATLLYGFFFGAILLSGYSDDFFFTGLAFIAKLLPVSWLVYRLPVWWRSIRPSTATLKRIVPA